MDTNPDQLITLPPPGGVKITRQAGFDTLCWALAFLVLAASPALLLAAWGWAL